MAYHDFLLIYSVSALSGHEHATKSAEKVRRKIAELNLWDKLAHVETAFVGKLYLVSSRDVEKRQEAEEDIRQVIRQAVGHLVEFSDVSVNIALSVDQLGKCMEFKV